MDNDRPMACRIEDYALIGDCQTAALVGLTGSIDWLCFPRFDSGACFAALLGTPDHGRWLLAPEGEVRSVRRQYRPGTLVLETEFETDGGAVRVTDFMPPRTHTPDLFRVSPRQDRATKLLSYLGDVIVNGRPDVKGKLDPTRVLPEPRVPEFRSFL